MNTYKSDFLNVLAARGFIQQVSEPQALDALASSSTITGYIGFDCTAPSLHVGSLLPIMLLYWLQQTGHRPIALMGGGTTRVGDPSGKDESRRLLSDQAIDDNLKGIRAIFSRFLRFGDGPVEKSANDAVMANNADWLNKLNYIDFLRDIGRHFSINRMLVVQFGEAAARASAGIVVPRIQLHDLAGLRFRRTLSALRLRAADGRLGSVGQYRQRHRSWPPPAQRAILRADRTAHHHLLGRQDGQDRFRRGLAQCRSSQSVRILAVLAQHRRRRRRAVLEIVHGAAARRDRPARRAQGCRDQRSEKGPGD